MEIGPGSLFKAYNYETRKESDYYRIVSGYFQFWPSLVDYADNKRVIAQKQKWVLITTTVEAVDNFKNKKYNYVEIYNLMDDLDYKQFRYLGDLKKSDIVCMDAMKKKYIKPNKIM
jgi:hypothetical protein